MTAPVATIITDNPIVVPLAQMQLMPEGVMEMAKWVEKYRPKCLPEGGFQTMMDLVPHDGTEPDQQVYSPAHHAMVPRVVTDNELLAEFAGRKCFDARTEVLTPTGWVTFATLSRNTPVATLNAKDNVIEFQMPTDYIEKRHSGQMYCVESRAFSIRVTDDHDMWVRTAKGLPWKFVPAAELQGTTYAIQRCAPLSPSPVGIDVSPAWAAFMGYYLSEGTLVDGKKYGCGSRVVLYQRPETAGPILAVLDALKISPYLKTDPRSGVLQIVINKTELAVQLSELGTHSYNKRMPRDVFTWSAENRAVLLDALMYGDGTTHENGTRVYTTTSKQLADDVQTLIVLSGKPGSISSIEPSDGQGTSFKGNHRVYRVREGMQTINEVNTHGTVHDALESTVDETVWCVTVPNRILVLRRADKVFMASNCYDSFADAGAKRTNGEYLKSMWEGRIPHRSTGYHAKMTFFFAHISRRVSHELIRNYVGSDRDEEGSPSQESTRFTHHPGTYIAHPYYLEQSHELGLFRKRAQANYEDYVSTIERKVAAFKGRTGAEPKGLDKKRIYESSAGDLLMSCGTSFIWSTNPMALTKFFHERDDESADMEMCRFARKVKEVSFKLWPNLFVGFDQKR